MESLLSVLLMSLAALCGSVSQLDMPLQQNLDCGRYTDDPVQMNFPEQGKS